MGSAMPTAIAAESRLRDWRLTIVSPLGRASQHAFFASLPRIQVADLVVNEITSWCRQTGLKSLFDRSRHYQRWTN